MANYTDAECRDCGDVTRCDDQTLHEVERVSHAEGWTDIDYTVTTGQCDSCLENNGADEHFVADEAQDEAEARAEAEYREREGSEL